MGLYTVPHWYPESTLSRPVWVASWPVVGKVFGFTWSVLRYVMIGAPGSSFGNTAELMFGCAVYAASNSVAAVGGSHVSAVFATSTHFLAAKCALRIAS